MYNEIGELVCMGQMRNAYKILVSYLKQRGLSRYV
jgi:hypothetical protein